VKVVVQIAQDLGAVRIARSHSDPSSVDGEDIRRVLMGRQTKRENIPGTRQVRIQVDL
jgi:hypothetical protein